MEKSKELKARLDDAGIRYWAGDNISSVMQPGDKEALIQELEDKFKTVLDGLVIDTANDPNSQKTARRLSKMYINELMSGRYDQCPMQQRSPM